MKEASVCVRKNNLDIVSSIRVLFSTIKFSIVNRSSWFRLCSKGNDANKQINKTIENIIIVRKDICLSFLINVIPRIYLHNVWIIAAESDIITPPTKSCASRINRSGLCCGMPVSRLPMADNRNRCTYNSPNKVLRLANKSPLCWGGACFSSADGRQSKQMHISIRTTLSSD